MVEAQFSDNTILISDARIRYWPKIWDWRPGHIILKMPRGLHTTIYSKRKPYYLKTKARNLILYVLNELIMLIRRR